MVNRTALKMSTLFNINQAQAPVYFDWVEQLISCSLLYILPRQKLDNATIAAVFRSGGMSEYQCKGIRPCPANGNGARVVLNEYIHRPNGPRLMFLARRWRNQLRQGTVAAGQANLTLNNGADRSNRNQQKFPDIADNWVWTQPRRLAMSKINEVAGTCFRYGCLWLLTDAIESGQYKYALQVCNKSLKKAKAGAENHTFNVSVYCGSGRANMSKAYKALALLLLDNGKDDEAIALVDQVRKTHPADRKLIAILAQALDLLGKGRLFE
jgi:hypothetical protein